ncbi:MAG: heavy metal-associated domain-containing protein, partial [Halopseudomonas yangmingensis]
MISITLPLSGMNCASCVRRIEQAVSGLPGVGRIEANLAAESLRLELQRPEQLADACSAIQRAGYGVISEERQLQFDNLTCAGCVRRVENALLGVPGVISAEVNLASQRARVRLLPDCDKSQ